MPETSLFFLAESAHETGFLKVRELPCWEFGGVCDLEQEQESERFHHKKRDSGLMILGRTLEYSRFVIESFCPERPVIFEEPEMCVVKHQSTPWMSF